MGKGLKPFVGKTCRYLSNVKSAIFEDEKIDDSSVDVITARRSARLRR